ncbi:MAG: phasin family protein [Burkholderiaceae bacterium]
MVKKSDKSSESEATFSAGSVKESAQQIWLAGLGAFAKAQAEGGKVFEALVKEGATLQKKTQSAAEEKLGEVSTRMSSMAGEVQARAGQRWDKIESIFEDRTAKALARLGVPAAKDLQALEARVAALEAQLAKPARKAVARKAAAKPTTLVKASSRRTATRKPA